jgi:CHAT domain-containing protein/Tfp pilus assembly protein PilF
MEISRMMAFTCSWWSKSFSESARENMKLTKCVLGSLFLLLGLAISTVAADSVPAERSMEEGRQAFQRGAFEQAAVSWTEAAEYYERAGKVLERSEALFRLSEAYQAVGQYRKALQKLESAQRLAAQLGDQAWIATILGSLGNLYAAAGQYPEAARYLNEGLRMAKDLGDAGLSARVLNNLGNLWAAQKRYPEALAAYADSIRSAKVAQDESVLTRALINAATVSIQMNEYQRAKDHLDSALKQMQGLDPSHDKSYGLITIGLAYDTLRSSLPGAQTELFQQAFRAFNMAAAVSEQLGDSLARSYALGHLASLYESKRQYQEALDLTRRAIFSAQLVVAPEALFQWHWQAGRLMKKLGQPDEAIAAYRRAVYALQSIRSEMTSAYGLTPPSFRESIGPVYFELADLLLQRSASLTGREQEEEYLKEARDAVELFKVGELRDYFRDDCVDAAKSRVKGLEFVSKTAAVIYPILLPDRTELLVSLPKGLKRFVVPVSAERLTREVRAFREFLEKRSTQEFLPHAQQIYDWLIRPLEPALVESAIDTLVFVPDGPLRTIPVSALHDGKEYLISKFAVATTPSLTLTDPRPLKRETILVLSAGLTESVQGFPPLKYVSEELQTIQRLYGGTLLLNREFLVSRMEQELKERPFSVVHIASHGEFASDVKKSFLLTFDGKLTMDRLEQFVGLYRFREDPLALLVLSACETAAGDDRAALGLAGVAIKAGATSALATLWLISDEASTKLVSEFYRQLQDPSLSKAVALQRAQLKMLNDPVYHHPAYWAAFLLLNNWL